jgi:hypothetical protein
VGGTLNSRVVSSVVREKETGEAFQEVERDTSDMEEEDDDEVAETMGAFSGDMEENVDAENNDDPLDCAFMGDEPACTLPPLGGSGKKERKSIGATNSDGERTSTGVGRKSKMQHLTTMHDTSMSSMYEMRQHIQTSMQRGQEQNQSNM